MQKRSIPHPPHKSHVLFEFRFGISRKFLFKGAKIFALLSRDPNSVRKLPVYKGPLQSHVSLLLEKNIAALVSQIHSRLCLIIQPFNLN